MEPTTGVLNQLESLGFSNLRVVASGVDTVRFDPRWRSDDLRKRWGAGPDTRVVLHTGRIAPEKNLALLFDAFDARRRLDPDLILVLVGDGPLRKEIEQHYPQTIFAGLQTGAALAVHYASAARTTARGLGWRRIVAQVERFYCAAVAAGEAGPHWGRLSDAFPGAGSCPTGADDRGEEIASHPLHHPHHRCR